MSDFSQNKNSRTAPGQPSCVRCGCCCNKRVCVNGVEDGFGDCRFLEVADKELGTFICRIRDVIMEAEKDSSTPMFDNYCSGSLFNDVRDEVIRRMKDIIQ